MALFLIVALTVYFNIQRVIVHGRSMEPTLHDGDALVAWKTAPREKLREGDVIVFRDSQRRRTHQAHRVCTERAGNGEAPGKRPNPRNGAPLAHVFQDYNAAVAAGKTPRPSRENTIWVMGDNTDNSEDSRVFGPIRPDQIVGQVFVKDIGPE